MRCWHELTAGWRLRPDELGKVHRQLDSLKAWMNQLTAQQSRLQQLHQPANHHQPH